MSNMAVAQKHSNRWGCAVLFGFVLVGLAFCGGPKEKKEYLASDNRDSVETCRQINSIMADVIETGQGAMLNDEPGS